MALMSGGVLHVAFHVVLEEENNSGDKGVATKIIAFFLIVGVLGLIIWGGWNGDPGP